MKKIYILILGLIPLIGIAIYAVFFSREKPITDIIYTVEKTETPNAHELAKKTEAKKAQDYTSAFNTAIKTKNHAACEAIEDRVKQQECHDTIDAGIIRIEKNQEKCKTLKTESLQLLCADIIQNDRAIESWDVSLCEAIIDTNKKEYCNKITEEQLFRKKIANGDITTEYCLTLSETLKEACINEKAHINDTKNNEEAIRTDDIQTCYKISDPALKNTCIESIALKKAQSENNPTFCQPITNTDYREQCEKRVTQKNDTTLYQEAIDQNNINLCESISRLKIKNKCHDTLIMSRVKDEKNPEICELLRDGSMIPLCKETLQ